MFDALSQFHFIRPWFLVLIVIGLGALIYTIFFYQAQGQWHRYIDKKLLPYLVDGQLAPGKRWPLFTLFLLWSILSIGLAGPTWERTQQPVMRDNSALVILWDLSPSMYAQDLKPSRLVRARLKLLDLLDARHDGLTGLIVYSGGAHVVTPLTDDTKTIKSLLPGLSPEMMPSYGSNAERALELANTLLSDAGVNKGSIVFLTDGIVYDALTQLKSHASDNAHKITVWGIGTEVGAPISIPSGGFVKNDQGEIIIAKLDHAAMSDAAIAMNAGYIPFTNDDSDINSILHFGFQSGEQLQNIDDRKVDQWNEQGHWLVLLCLPFLAFAFRRGWLLVCLVGVMSYPQPSVALDWSVLWKNQDQRAHDKLKNGDVEAAMEAFEDPDWKAVAAYRAGEFEDARSTFSKNESPESLYNLGNALTHQGMYDEAIYAYTQALDAKPGWNKAEENKKVAEQLKALEEQSKEQSDKNESSNQENQDSNQDQSNQESSNQENSKQSNSEQQKSDQQNSQNSENSDSQQDEQGQESENKQNQANQNDSQSPDEQANKAEQSPQDTDETTKDQQQALEDHYQQPQQEEGEQEPSESNDRQTYLEENPEEQQPENQENSSDEKTAYKQKDMTPEELEKQQAMEQWLRRVPDDPTGLLRNKFRYEYNKRRRENFERAIQTPNDTPKQERW